MRFSIHRSIYNESRFYIVVDNNLLRTEKGMIIDFASFREAVALLKKRYPYPRYCKKNIYNNRRGTPILTLIMIDTDKSFK